MKKIFLFVLVIIFAAQISYARTTKEPVNNKLQYINLQWWERYHDPILYEHMQAVYTKNHDLKIATLKVKEGEKLVKISFSQELPQLSFNGGLNRNLKSSNLQFGDLVIPSFKQSELQLPLTMSYEVDIWGINRFKTKSIERQLEMIQQDERASYIALSSAFAAQYFNLIRIDKLVDTQQEIVDIQKKIVQKTEKKYQNGLCTKNDVLNEEKALTYLTVELNNLVDAQAVLVHELRVYLSTESDAPIKRSKYNDIKLLPTLPKHFDSDVISNRPDYLRAENNIKRAGYNVKIAKRDFLPKFVIFGQLGFNAYQFNKLFTSPAGMASAGVLPSVDIFDGGRKFAVMKLKKYEYDESIQKYEKTILTSFQELNDSLCGAVTAEKNYSDSQDRVKYENNLFRLLSRKAQIGAASDLDVLYGKEKQLLTEKDEIINKINFLISSINIYKAVGGQDLYEIVEHI